jgi:hypothetical protein
MLVQRVVIFSLGAAFSSTASWLVLRRATDDLLRVLAGDQPFHPMAEP